jgi:hypothetical protein
VRPGIEKHVTKDENTVRKSVNAFMALEIKSLTIPAIQTVAVPPEKESGDLV